MAEHLQNPTRSKLVAIGFLAPVALIGILSFISYHFATQSATSFNWVTHTYEVIQEIDATTARLVDMESALRGYTITGRETYLEAHTNTLEKITNHLAQLEFLVKDKPHQVTNVAILKSLAAQKIARAELGKLVRQRDGFEAAQQMSTGDTGKILMDKIRRVTGDLRAEELRLLGVREAKYEFNASRVEFCALAFVVAAIAVLVMVVLLLVRVQRLENMVTTAAWTEQVDRGPEGASFEVYLKDRLGKKDQEGVSAETVRQITRELEAWAKKKDAE